MRSGDLTASMATQETLCTNGRSRHAHWIRRPVGEKATCARLIIHSGSCKLWRRTSGQLVQDEQLEARGTAAFEDKQAALDILARLRIEMDRATYRFRSAQRFKQAATDAICDLARCQQ